FSATAALLEIQNTAPAGSNVWVCPDYIKLTVSVADVTSAAGSFNAVFSLDSKLRYASGGTQIVTPGTYANNYGPMQTLRTGPGANLSHLPQAAVFLGALVLNAESGNVVRSSRCVAKVGAAANLSPVGDEYVFTFGQGEDVGAGFAKTGTTAAIYRENVGQKAIGPQSSMALHFWCPNITTGLTVELDAAWFEVTADVG
ncbi:MAG TPA: hypothetical protein VJS20_06190, partial [Gemmatimonadales bacterium]|nr:hypothetical protein [Gemmatimonadales bacterium]